MIFVPKTVVLPPKPIGPFFAVPTTTGTGSEISGAAVITEEATHHKLLVLNCTPHMAFLDPELVAGMPPAITAATGMDALTHAVEAFISVQKNPLSDSYAATAVRLIAENLPAVL
ncbi:MAG: iron-containing alcohol dehydrogenase, partial [Anaerolineales bacterium]